MQNCGVQVGAPRSHTAQTLAVRAAGMSCFQARKNLFRSAFVLRYGTCKIPQPQPAPRFLTSKALGHTGVSARFLRIRVSLESGFG